MVPESNNFPTDSPEVAIEHRATLPNRRHLT